MARVGSWRFVELLFGYGRRSRTACEDFELMISMTVKIGFYPFLACYFFIPTRKIHCHCYSFVHK